MTISRITPLRSRPPSTGLRRRIGKGRLVAVLEARSNTMRMGVHKDTLAPSLQGADAVYLFAPPDLGWDAGAVAAAIGANAATEPSVDSLLQRLLRELRPGDHALVMSNGGFGGLHGATAGGALGAPAAGCNSDPGLGPVMRLPMPSGLQ